jgi:hypothetical protein
MESWTMSGNYNDYVTYGRLLQVGGPYSNCYISSGGAYGDNFLSISGTQGNPISATTRSLPGGPFTTLGTSFRLFVNNISGGGAYLSALDLVNGVTHCSVLFNGYTGTVSISNASGTIFTSAPGQFPIGARFWAEVKFVVGSGTSGAVYVQLPNTSISLTGVNTQNGSRGYVDTTSWNVYGPGSGAMNMNVQHQHWWDTTGSYNNNWIGDSRVFGALPTSNGDTDQFTPTGLSSNYLNAANAPPNGSDYNVSGTVGNIDLYKGPYPANVTAVHAVMASAITEKDDSGTRSFCTEIKSGGTLASGLSLAMTSSIYLNNADIFETDPSTGVPFIPAALPNLQYGGKVSA